jgi:S1-C subfamily serine protease
VVSLSSTDPTAIMRSLAAGEGGDFEMQSEVSDLRILLEDGTEIPAQIVLRDAELDLAYVQPTEAPPAPLPHIDFSAPGTAQLLDTVVALNRLGRVANRVYSASFERIEAIVQRPRTFYIPGSDPTHSAQGSPVFSLDGDIVGLIVMRAIRNTGGGGRMFGGNDSVMAIVLPASDILEGARQVPGFGATE